MHKLLVDIALVISIKQACRNDLLHWLILGANGLLKNKIIKQCYINNEYRTDTGVHHPKSNEGRKEMFYLTSHSTHFIYGNMASDQE